MDDETNSLRGRLPERLLYRASEGAEILAMSRSKVYELIRSGELASITVGGSRRIPAQALIDFVEKQSA